MRKENIQEGKTIYLNKEIEKDNKVLKTFKCVVLILMVIDTILIIKKISRTIAELRN